MRRVKVSELEQMTCKQLLEIAKQINLKGRHKMKKEELIYSISNNESSLEDEPENEVVIDAEVKKRYTNNAQIGTIVAFKTSTGKVRAAKIINKSTKNEKLKLQTKYGKEYIISYSDIIWVRTGTRWPKGIYNMLKGIAK